jgi:hypothetical protein
MPPIERLVEREKLAAVAELLERLAASSPTDTAALTAWYERTEAFEKTLDTEYRSIELPNVVRHYLNDADIRFKDAEYKASQEAQIAEVIAALRSGTIPESRGVTLSFRPASALAVIAVLVALSLLAKSCGE